MKPGDHVRLVTPDNPRLHGAAAVVVELRPWGALVRTAAAATGQFRALFGEMAPAEQNGNGWQPEYTGDECDLCGSSRMIRSGVCSTCQDCGTTSGCS